MEVQIIIGKRIPQSKTPKSTYQVDIEFMHGDADGTTYRTLKFKEKDLERLKQYVVLNDCMTKRDNELDEDKAAEKLIAMGFSEKAALEVIESFRDDTMEGDITCDGMRNAAVVAFDVTYWDEDGIQHHVDCKVN